MCALEKSIEQAQESEAPRRLVPVKTKEKSLPNIIQQGRKGRCRVGS